MYKFLTKNGQTIAFALGLLITAIFLIMVFNGIEDFYATVEEDRNKSNLFNFGINSSVGLIILCTIGMIVFIILNVILNIKGNLKLLAGIAVVAIIYFASSAGATFEAPGTVIGDKLVDFGITGGQNGFIVGGIWTALVLVILAFGSFIILEIVNFFK